MGLAVGGFINDAAALSSFGLITAQSAGMKPQPGESLRTWNLRMTPFRPLQRAQANAISDGGSGGAHALTAGSSGGPATAASVHLSGQEQVVVASDSQIVPEAEGSDELEETKGS